LTWEEEGWRSFEGRTTVQPLVPFNRGQLYEDDEFHSAFEASLPEGNKWSQPPGKLFWCRGKSYLYDKQKFTSRPPLFPLVGLDLWKCVPTAEGGPGPQHHVCIHPCSYVQKVLRDPSTDPHVAKYLLEAKEAKAAAKTAKRQAAAAAAGGGSKDDDDDDDEALDEEYGVHFFVMNFILPFGNFVAYFLRPLPNLPGAEEAAALRLAKAKARQAGVGADAGGGDEMSVEACEEECAELRSRALTRQLYNGFVEAEEDQYRDDRLKVMV
jgi:hypothetical protein